MGGASESPGKGVGLQGGGSHSCFSAHVHPMHPPETLRDTADLPHHTPLFLVHPWNPCPQRRRLLAPPPAVRAARCWEAQLRAVVNSPLLPRGRSPRVRGCVTSSPSTQWQHLSFYCALRFHGQEPDRTQWRRLASSSQPLGTQLGRPEGGGTWAAGPWTPLASGWGEGLGLRRELLLSFVHHGRGFERVPRAAGQGGSRCNFAFCVVF